MNNNENNNNNNGTKFSNRFFDRTVGQNGAVNPDALTGPISGIQKLMEYSILPHSALYAAAKWSFSTNGNDDRLM